MVLAHLRELVAATDLPVNADYEHGYADAPEQVAEKIRAFYDAGVRHLVLDLVGPYEERPEQIESFAREVLPLLSDLRA